MEVETVRAATADALASYEQELADARSKASSLAITDGVAGANVAPLRDENVGKADVKERSCPARRNRPRQWREWACPGTPTLHLRCRSRPPLGKNLIFGCGDT